MSGLMADELLVSTIAQMGKCFQSFQFIMAYSLEEIIHVLYNTKLEAKTIIFYNKISIQFTVFYALMTI